MVTILTSVVLFVTASLAEIGGGYLVWLWLRENRPLLFGLLAIPVLFAYGIIPTLQPAHFGRVYAAYGGVFVAMSLLWGWLVDHQRPDTFDIIGALIAIVGMSIIMWWPRS